MRIFLSLELSWGCSTRNNREDRQPNSWDNSYISNSEQSELYQSQMDQIRAECLQVL